MKHALILILALWAATPAVAGVRIESIDDEGRHSTVFIEGDKARIDHAIPDGYMIVDLDSARVYAVDGAHHLVMDLGTPFVPPSAHAAVAMRPRRPQVTMEDLGPGPEIHGYATTHYRVSVSGRHCFDEFLAAEAAADPRIQRFLSTLAGLSDSADEVRHNLLFSDADPCDAAADTIDDRYPELGLPLRTVRADGRVSHEITRIELDAPLAAETFAWPEDYPLLSRRAVHERLGKQNDEAALAEALQRHQRIQAEIRDLTE